MKAPSRQFWMGTDNLGRDIWSRVVYGARISVTVGFATVALATVLAAAIGVSSAYLGGAYDLVVQRIVDAWMSFPALVIVLSLLAALGPGLLNLILALSVLGAAGASRVIRGATRCPPCRTRTSRQPAPSGPGTSVSSCAICSPT